MEVRRKSKERTNDLINFMVDCIDMGEDKSEDEGFIESKFEKDQSFSNDKGLCGGLGLMATTPQPSLSPSSPRAWPSIPTFSRTYRGRWTKSLRTTAEPLMGQNSINLICFAFQN